METQTQVTILQGEFVICDWLLLVLYTLMRTFNFLQGNFARASPNRVQSALFQIKIFTCSMGIDCNTCRYFAIPSSL